MRQNSQFSIAKFSNLCDEILKSPLQNSQIYYLNESIEGG